MYEYPLASSTWGGEELQAITRVMESGFYSMGEFVAEFESAFASFHGSKFATMVNSGSSANLIATTSLHIKNLGSSKVFDVRESSAREVICPAVSWSTTYFPLIQNGFTIKLVDVDVDTYNIDVNQVAAAISDKTVGILAVNLLGNPADLKSLRTIATENDVWLIEDNCESMGARSNDSYTGTLGDCGTFSFFYSHHICTMEGGMVLTDDSDLDEILKSLRAHGWARHIPIEKSFMGQERANSWEENFRFYLPGYNLRPLEMEGAIGIEQLRKFPELLETRVKNADTLKRLLESNDIEYRLQHVRPSDQSSWFTFGFVPKHKPITVSREQTIRKLEKVGIQSRPLVAGNIARHPVSKYIDFNANSELVASDFIHDHGFMVGNHGFDITPQLELLVENLK